MARRLLHFTILLAGFTALTALFFAPVLGRLSTALLGPAEDNLQDFWNSWYAAVGAHGHFFFTHLIRFPEGVSLIYHSFAYPQVAAVWGLSAVFGHDLSTLILLQNLTILASFPLGAVGAYYLCRHLSRSEMGGALGAFVFAFNPWHVAQAMHHAHVASVEFLPWFALSYLLARERKSPAWLVCASMLFALSALCCWYFLFYGLYFLIFDALVRIWRARKDARPDWRWIAGAPFACALGTTLLLSPLVLPMLGGGPENAYKPGGNIFVADLLGYVAFPPTHLFAAEGLYRSFTGNAWEATVYLGMINLALLLYALATARDAARSTLLYAVGGALFFMAIASGELLHLHGQALPVHMPGIVLSKLPFFANVRTPARAMVLGYLFLSIGVAVAIAQLGRMRAGRLLVGAAALLVVLDFLPVHLATTPMACAQGLAVLRNDPDRGFGVLDLPDTYEQENAYMAQQACHGRPIVTGVVARQLKPTLGDRLNLHDMDALRPVLTRARVKYILLHGPGAPRGAGGYRSVAKSPELEVLQVY